MKYGDYMARRATILALPEAKGREDLALHLLSSTNGAMSVEQIRVALQRQPAPVSAGPLQASTTADAVPGELSRLAREATDRARAADRAAAAARPAITVPTPTLADRMKTMLVAQGRTPHDPLKRAPGPDHSSGHLTRET